MMFGISVRKAGLIAGGALLALGGLTTFPGEASADDRRIVVIQSRDRVRLDRGSRGRGIVRNGIRNGIVGNAISAGALGGLINQNLVNQALNFRDQRLLERRERALDRAFRDERNGDFDRADRQFDRADRLDDRLEPRSGEVFLRGDDFRDERLLRSRSFRNGEIRSLGRSRRPVIFLRGRDRDCDF
jgi:hypothetical protein